VTERQTLQKHRMALCQGLMEATVCLLLRGQVFGLETQHAALGGKLPCCTP